MFGRSRNLTDGQNAHDCILQSGDVAVTFDNTVDSPWKAYAANFSTPMPNTHYVINVWEYPGEQVFVISGKTVNGFTGTFRRAIEGGAGSVITHWEAICVR